MPKRYWWIIITYIVCQLSGVIPAIMYMNHGITKTQLEALSPIWILISFSITLVIVLLLLLPEKNIRATVERASTIEAITWGVIGIFLAFIVQVISSNIDIHLLGGSDVSKNTSHIVKLTETAPYIILIVAIVGPILEEIIFRKIIFGTLYKKTNFWIAGLISSLIFALVHMDHHLIIYMSIGLLFAYLYAKTNRIITSIIAHASMNAVVVIIQIMYSDQIQKVIDHSKQALAIKDLFH